MELGPKEGQLLPKFLRFIEVAISRSKPSDFFVSFAVFGRYNCKFLKDAYVYNFQFCLMLNIHKWTMKSSIYHQVNYSILYKIWKVKNKLNYLFYLGSKRSCSLDVCMYLDYELWVAEKNECTLSYCLPDVLYMQRQCLSY